ncbi:MAG: hypothetical protein QM704_21560 [Anaeromyxobacteraceae bacterium]
MDSIDAKTRAAIARGWATSALNQEDYAAQHGISPRTLRLWISRHASRQPPVEQERGIITEAIGQLQDVLDALHDQEELDPACRPEAQVPADDAPVETVPVLEGAALVSMVEATRAALAQEEAGASPEVARPKVRRGSFFADMG